ncbi:hypothetical protein ACXR2U_10990 [Jatrophihabitans sp. YIM 134969]
MALPTPLRALFLGFATGSRSSYGLAALTLTAPAAVAETPLVEHALSTPAAKVAAAVAAVGETTGDKLPATPSRLSAGGLPFRAVNGAGCGVLLARREGVSEGAPALIGLTGALATTYAGAWFRAAAVRWFGHDAWGAVIEDGVAATFAVLGVRR